MAESEAAVKRAKSAKVAYSDGHPQDVIQYLEAKLILKPDFCFPRPFYTSLC